MLTRIWFKCVECSWFVWWSSGFRQRVGVVCVCVLSNGVHARSNVVKSSVVYCDCGESPSFVGIPSCDPRRSCAWMRSTDKNNAKRSNSIILLMCFREFSHVQSSRVVIPGDLLCLDEKQ